MSLFRRRNERRVRTERQRENEKFLGSLHNKEQINITNENISRWTVRGDYLYFIDVYHDKKIFVYSTAQRSVNRELQHTNRVYDFAFVGANFLVSVGQSYVRVWNARDGALLASKKYEKKYGGYVTCSAVSPTSFLYISQDTIRRLRIITPNSSVNLVQIEQINTTTFNEIVIWPSEVCGGKIALVFKIEKKLNIFDVTTFKVTAQFDLSPHLKEVFELGKHKKYDISFPDRVVFCVADSTHSQLKILILDPSNLNVRKTFVTPNPIHSTLEQHSKLREDGFLWIDACASTIRMQYRCHFCYQIFYISMDEEKVTSSYSFQTEKFIIPNCKSLCNGVLVVDKDSQLKLGKTSNKLRGEMEKSLNLIQGPIERLYQECTRLGKRAVAFCEQLSPALFNGSLFELYCAHRLLMMAIQDGDVPRSLHYNGVNLKWHEAIYSESRNIILETPEDKDDLIIILMEAAEQNVIESVGQFLLANQILAEVRDQNQKIFNLGRQLFVRLIQLEAAHINLDLAFERYKKVQGMTELMGIALNVIPFLGGSVAAAVTAGADLVEGLQISDAIEDALQASVDMISSSPTFEQGVLRCVENSLRKDEVKKRIELLTSLQKCGLTIDQLQELLKNGIIANEDEKVLNNEGPNTVDIAAMNLGEISVSDQGTVCALAIVEDSSADDSQLPAAEKLISTLEDTREISYQAVGSSSQSRNYSNPKEDLSHMEEWNISDFKRLSDDRETVRSLTVRQCSYFVAALMLLFDDDFEDEFRTLRPLLFGIHKSRMISGKVLCGYSKYYKAIDGIIPDLQNIYPVNDIMIGEFMDFVKNNKELRE